MEFFTCYSQKNDDENDWWDFNIEDSSFGVSYDTFSEFNSSNQNGNSLKSQDTGNSLNIFKDPFELKIVDRVDFSFFDELSQENQKTQINQTQGNQINQNQVYQCNQDHIYQANQELQANQNQAYQSNQNQKYLLDQYQSYFVSIKLNQRFQRKTCIPDVAKREMRSWLFSNWFKPIPKQNEIENFANKYDLTDKQVRTFFANNRGRVLQYKKRQMRKFPLFIYDFEY